MFPVTTPHPIRKKLSGEKPLVKTIPSISLLKLPLSSVAQCRLHVCAQGRGPTFHLMCMALF